MATKEIVDVEFVLNCFERNIDAVLAPEFLTRAMAQHRYPFALRTVLINNVSDPERAALMAESAVNRGEIDRYLFVNQLVEEGLRVTNLRRRDFGRYLHWSDCCLAALVADGPDHLCYVDVDLELKEPTDWISPALDVMAVDPRVKVGNPNWVMADGRTTVAEESDDIGVSHFIGYGFTDQVFLVRRSHFARSLRTRVVPLWVQCPATLRWTGAQGGLFFEQVMDGYMRRSYSMRVTIATAEFEPIPMSSYPQVSIVERAMARRDARILAFLHAVRRRFPQLVTNPRFRTTGLLDPAIAKIP
jgi:hypothetical protein